MHSPHNRTTDVRTREDILFSELHLPETLLKGLNEAGFINPSPIQLQAIPVGRFGIDLVAQAKAGTGKTCVFGVLSLDTVNTSVKSPQVLIVSPTREIARQSCDVIVQLGKYIPDFRCGCFIGGTAVQDDLEQVSCCQIVTGTPGRLKQLIDEGHLKTDHIKSFVLDEADQLLSSSFFETIDEIFKALPGKKQVMTFSATYSEDIESRINAFTNSPYKIILSNDNLTLVGVKLYKKTLVSRETEVLLSSLCEVLSSLAFQQCVIFSNSSQTNQEICRRLKLEGYPVGAIAGSMTQSERNEVIKALRTNGIRILISTDLTARGVDIENINLVINLDIPTDPETFIHRVGRTGRFGSYGSAISFVTSDDENPLQFISQTYSVTLEELPSEIPADMWAMQEEPGRAKDPQTVSPKASFSGSALTRSEPISEIFGPPLRQRTQIQQIQQQQQREARQMNIEERGRARPFAVFPEVPQDSDILLLVKEKGWPEPRPLCRLMETEEWSHPKSVDVRKRVRAWKYDVYYTKAALQEEKGELTPTGSPLPEGSTYHGYISKTPPDVIKPLVEISQKRRNLTYSAPTPTALSSNLSQPLNFHTFQLTHPKTSNSTHNSPSPSSSTKKEGSHPNFYF